MSMIGKIVGALLGLVLLHGPMGLLIGAVLGHFYDVAATRIRPATLGRAFVEPLFGFAGALAKSDGRVSEHEIAAAEALMSRLRLDAVQRRSAIERFAAGKQADFQVHPAIADLKAWCGGRRALAFLLLDLLLDLVYAEGAPVPAKIALLQQLCRALGVHDRELAALAAMKGYASPAGPSPRARAPRPGVAPGPDPYAVLGVSRSDSGREIKHAYRKLMSQHHPDKLGNVPDELKRRAENRAREINAAYEKIKLERRF
ncbi:MAG TPA: co-chaperone DjlA [Rhodanobacteraceae bacterium]|nr:co-chaperone DjlA [Rhodanobacteraceae bacterium]